MKITIKNQFPQGLGTLFFIQIFSTISFAVMYASLVLYMRDVLKLSSHEADLITGIYFAYNFGLHLLSGMIAGRFFSYRFLIAIGVLFQLLGSLILMHSAMWSLYLGLSCMLVGTGSMVTCINMLVSQFFEPGDKHRESAFLWNYSGMNIGFILGFVVAGYYQLNHDYYMLFLVTAFMNLVTLFVLSYGWPQLADKKSYISSLPANSYYKQIAKGFVIIFLLIPCLYILLQHEKFSDYFVLTIGSLVVIYILRVAFRLPKVARNKMLTFLILLACAQVFWIIYQLAPMGLTLFAQDNVVRKFGSFVIAPGWIQNINSITIVLGGPLLALLFKRIRKAKRKVTLANQYSSGLLIGGLGLLVLPVGIYFANSHGFVAFHWIVFSYIFAAIAELLISPIGYSMVGQLIPASLQSIMMGVVLLNSGIAAVLASFFSNYAIGSVKTTNPLITNPTFSHAFMVLGSAAVVVAILVFVFTPILNKMARAEQTPRVKNNRKFKILTKK